MDRKFRLALIGCGKVAEKHLRAAAQNADCIELAAIADSNPAAISARLDASPLPSASKARVARYSDYAKMLSEQRPDIVSVTVPSGLHASVGLDAIRAGASLLLEKPMTLSLSEADLLIREAERFHVKIALGQIYRFFPFVGQIVRDLRDGMYGDILYGNVRVFWGHDQAYYDQAVWRGTWKQDGGALMNQSVHALDLMNYLMGSRVCEVSGMIARQRHAMEAEDLGLGLLRYENGAFCTVEGTTNTNPDFKEADFTLVCADGCIRAGLRRGKPYLDVRDGRGKKCGSRYVRGLIRETFSDGGFAAAARLSNPHSGILRDLCRAMAQDASPRADGQSGRDALEQVLAVYRSAKIKSPVKLPLEGFSTDDMIGFFDS